MGRHLRTRTGEGGVTEYLIYAPLHEYLHLLAQGWRLPNPVEPMMGSHGDHSILLHRGAL